MTGDTGEPADARRNRILRTLPDAEHARLRPDLTRRDLNTGDILFEPGRPIEAVYFPLRGVFSMLANVEDTAIEVATIGDEGMIGLPVFLGAGTSTERAMCQVPGSALRMEADRFREHIAVMDGSLQQAMQRYTNTLFVQLARNTACNRSHLTRQRCARWLLMTADRMHANQFPLTQRFLAQMLAVRRSSVSEIAGSLAADGSIRYSRGVVTILDRQRLEDTACTCYRIIRDTTDAAFPAPSTEHGE